MVMLNDDDKRVIAATAKQDDEDTMRLASIRLRHMGSGDDSERLLCEVLSNWIYFRRSHDLNSVKVACCQVTRDFFATMQQLEDTLCGERS